MELRYGLNPQQQTASAEPVTPGAWPVRVLNGEPSYINLLDALSGWQLVREAARRWGGRRRRPSSTSRRPAPRSPGPLDPATAALYRFDPAEGIAGSLTSAYVRARDADPKSSYGDFAAVSHPVDEELAALLARVVCDGIVAPGYEPGTVAALSRKKKGRFLVLEADPAFVPPAQEEREVHGLRLTQQRDDVPLHASLLDDVVCGGSPLPAAAAEDLLLGLAVVRYTAVQLGLLRAGRGHARHRRGAAVAGRLHAAGGREGRQLVAAAPSRRAGAGVRRRGTPAGPRQLAGAVHRGRHDPRRAPPVRRRRWPHPRTGSTRAGRRWVGRRG